MGNVWPFNVNFSQSQCPSTEPAGTVEGDFLELWRFNQWKSCYAYTQVETQELDGHGLLSAPIKHYEKNHQNEIIKHTLI